MNIKPTNEQRLILSNQYLILEKIDPENADEYRHAREVFESGFVSEYNTVTMHLDPTEFGEELCEFVWSTMSLYDNLQSAFPDDRAKFTFIGFDGNNEGKYRAFAQFLVSHGNFTHIVQHHGLNSHSRRVEQYRAMLDRWKELGSPPAMTAEQAAVVAGT